MSKETFRATVTAEFDTQWALAYPLVPVMYENHRFEQPKTAWAAFEIHEINTGRAAVGTVRRFQREKGMITVCIYIPENTGTKAGLEMLDKAINIFEDRIIPLPDGESVTFYTGQSDKGGLKNGYYEMTAMIKYHRDASKPAVV